MIDLSIKVGYPLDLLGHYHPCVSLIHMTFHSSRDLSVCYGKF
jgi:hypothetical protein